MFLPFFLLFRCTKWCCKHARMIPHVLSFKMICVTSLSDDSKCQKWAIYFSQFLTYPRLSSYGVFAIFLLLGSPKWCYNDARMIPHVLSFKMICVTSLSDDSKCQKWAIYFSQFLTYPRLSLYGVFAVFLLLGSPKWCCNDARMIPHVLSFKMICVTSLSDDSKGQKLYVSIWFSLSCGVVSFCSFLE